MNFRIFGIAWIFPLTSVCLAGTSNTGATTEPIAMWGGEVWSQSTLDPMGKLDSITLYITMPALQGVPANEMQSVIVPLTHDAKGQTFFDHISLDWNPHGHEPLMSYGKPHFDIHFYHPSVKEIAALDCSIKSQIPEELLASGYVLPDLTVAGSCVPQMGIHAAPASDFAPDFQFSETFIYGYYGTELTFFEPMITQDFFLSHKTAEHTLNNPAAFNLLQKSIPSSYAVTYDEAADLYKITFKDFSGSGMPTAQTD